MAVRKLVYYPEGEARLRARCKPVPRVKTKKLRQLIQDLKDTLETQPGAAIAAPQIGALKRVTVVKFGQNEDAEEQPMLTLINPRILAAGRAEPGFDGCLSIPNLYSWDTPRPVWIEFKALGEDGSEMTRRVEGMDARVLHHELDHLDGILFIDRLRDPEELYTPVEGADGKTKMIRLVDLPQFTQRNG